MTKKNTKVNQYIELMESVPEFIEYTRWEHLQDRKIILDYDISVETVEYVTLQILKFNDEDKHLPIKERKPIYIYISSNGGNVIDGFNVIDVIKTSKTPVYTVALGLAASMAALIFISGHKRFAYPNSTVLLHDGALLLSSTSKKAKQTMEYYDKLDARIKKFILSNTKISEELYNQKSDEEWHLFGDDCVELGIVDEIIQ